MGVGPCGSRLRGCATRGLLEGLCCKEGLDLPGSQMATPNWGHMGTRPDCP